MKILLCLFLMSGCPIQTSGAIRDVGPYQAPRPPEVIWEKPEPRRKAPPSPRGVEFQGCFA